MGSFLEWMIESSLLIGLILMIRRFFTGKIRYAGIYALWLLVLVRFLVPVNMISTPLSVGTILSEKLSLSSYDSKDVVGISTKIPSQSISAPMSAAVWNGMNTSVDVTQETPLVSTGGQRPDSSRMLEKKQSEPNVISFFLKKISSEKGVCLLKNIWIFVSALFLFCFLLSYGRMTYRLRKNRTFYGKRGTIKIYTVSGIKNPCLYGFFRPVIYLPRFLIYGEAGVRVSREEREQMICHEYVHYRHGDSIWAMFRMLLLSFYWFHPFLWIAVSCAKRDAELFCDETVLRQIGESQRFGYGNMLIRLAADRKWQDFSYPMVSMSRRGKEMEMRIRAISSVRHYSKWLLLPLLAVVLLTVGVTCSTGIRPVAKSQRGVSNSKERKEKGSSSLEKSAKIKWQKAEGFFDGNHLFASYPGIGKNGAENNLLKTENRMLVPRDNVSFEEIFQNYIVIFTEAVNTGNTDRLAEVLAIDSDIYTRQNELVRNYYKRGIKEEVKLSMLSSVDMLSEKRVALNSIEKIKVNYAGKTEKLIHQSYQYMCDYQNGKWQITDMQELPTVKKESKKKAG